MNPRTEAILESNLAAGETIGHSGLVTVEIERDPGDPSLEEFAPSLETDRPGLAETESFTDLPALGVLITDLPFDDLNVPAADFTLIPPQLEANPHLAMQSHAPAPAPGPHTRAGAFERQISRRPS